MDQNAKFEKVREGKSYDSPKVTVISLRAEEAVLGHCKIAGSAGPVAASCASLACRTQGS